MERSIRFVLFGTFTLRFSTGLTGSMLAFYLAHLPEHGGPIDRRQGGRPVSPRPFYFAELVLSPLFGIISDRYGHHRVMLYGPVFGAIAVVLTGLTPAFLVFGANVMLLVLAATRILEGASSAASVPSILGYHRAGDCRQRGPPRQDLSPLRGCDAGRSRGRRDRRRQAVRVLREPRDRAGGLLPQRRVIYGVSFRSTRSGSGDPAGEAEARRRRARPGRSIPRPHPLVARLPARADLDRDQRGHRGLAEPIGLPAGEGRPALPRPGADGRLQRQSDHHRRDHHRRHLRRGPALLGQPLQDAAADDDHRVRRGRRSRSRVRRDRGQPPVGDRIGLLRSWPASLAAGGLFVLAGRDSGCHRSAGGHVGALPDRSRRDHGPVLGLPRDGPDHRRPDRRGRGRLARHRRDVRRHPDPARHRDRAARRSSGRRSTRSPSRSPEAWPARRST